jgi:hypothetical protein
MFCLDDILVASRSFEEHLQHLREVCTRLRDAGLRLKPRKCSLLRDEVPFLGHIISLMVCDQILRRLRCNATRPPLMQHKSDSF